MRSTSTRTSLLAVMAAALTVAPAAGALAATGGVQSAPAVTAAPRISHRASLATWFGPGFYGQRTACGQVLTPAVVGVAHRSLPCGTLVKVSYRGRQLIVPVIDRGPYAHNGAAWDLTSGAALALVRRAEWPPFGARPARPAFAPAHRNARRRSRLRRPRRPRPGSPPAAPSPGRGAAGATRRRPTEPPCARPGSRRAPARTRMPGGRTALRARGRAAAGAT